MVPSCNLLQKAAALAVLFILVHSIVDYPLRTMAVAVAFMFFHAILFHPDLPSPDQRVSSRRKVRRHSLSGTAGERIREPVVLRRLR
jgi:hypothetical protein